jgi:hypothetical protein
MKTPALNLLGLALLVGLLSACQAAPTVPAAPLLPVTPRPSPTSRIVLPATWTPTPYCSPTPSPTPLPTWTPVPPPWLSVLIPGAYPHTGQEWLVPRTCGSNRLYAQPYRPAEGGMSLVLVETIPDDAIFWDLAQDPLAAGRAWWVVQPFSRGPDIYMASFLAEDLQGQWWIGMVRGLCGTEAPHLTALLPIQYPDQAAMDAYWQQDENFYEYWVVDAGELFVYRWVEDAAQLYWKGGAARGRGLCVYNTSDRLLPDLTGDDQPEMVVFWYTPDLLNGCDALVESFTFYTIEPDGYRQIGAFPAGFQRTDTDHDGVRELLFPAPEALTWHVFDWNGIQYVPALAIGPLSPPQPQPVDAQALPPLPADLYFTRDGATWRWPQAGGALQAVAARPTPVAPACARPDGKYAYAWSPGCEYAIVDDPAWSGEGGAQCGLYNAQTQAITPIPHSFPCGAASSFAWDPGLNFVIHARLNWYHTDQGLYRIALPSGETTFWQPLQAGSMNGEPNGFGALDPMVLPDGAVGFSVQGRPETASLYPPYGVYRVGADGVLHWLAAFAAPAVHPDPNAEGLAGYGRLVWSPDGRAYIYWAASKGLSAPPYLSLLLGLSDGSALWDVSELLGAARDFQWDLSAR